MIVLRARLGLLALIIGLTGFAGLLVGGQQGLLEREAEVVCLLDKSLVALHFVNQHLHQHLVPGELDVDLIDVRFQTGDLGPILISLPLVLHLHRGYQIVTSALPDGKMRHVHRPTALRY